MKILLMVAGAFLAFGLVSWAPAQGNSEATRLHREALQLLRGASSKQDLEDAAKKFAVALSMFDHQKDKKGVRMAAFNLGLVHSRLGRYDEAAACYQRSLHLSRELKDLKGEVRALNNLAAVHRRLGRYDMAVAANEKALTKARSTGDRKAEAHSMLGLANVYQAQGAYDTAEDYYQKALATYRRMNDDAANRWLSGIWGISMRAGDPTTRR
jgi:tetratricopeptide (TPR) repeat protein